MVIALVGRTEWIAVYACTSKVSALPPELHGGADSGRFGCSQLYGEAQSPERIRTRGADDLRPTSSWMARHMRVLTGNPAFVRVWVGADFYGGHARNVAGGWNRRRLARPRPHNDRFRSRYRICRLALRARSPNRPDRPGSHPRHWWAARRDCRGPAGCGPGDLAPAGSPCSARRPAGVGPFLRETLWPALQRIGPPLLVSAAAGVLAPTRGWPRRPA